jgi:uncharacterized protein DUF3108
MNKRVCTFSRSFVAVMALVCGAIVCFAQRDGFGERREKGTVSPSVDPFVVGEKLAYEVSWSDFIVAGELTFETKERREVNGIDSFHVLAQAQSVGLVSAVALKVDDVYESFIDAATLLPFRAEKQSRHGKKRRQVSVTIDPKTRAATLSDGRTIDIPANTYDMAALLYAIRGMDLKIGNPRTFTLLEDNKLYTIVAEPEAREKITTRAGDFDTVRVATRMSNSDRTSDIYNLRLYITSDARRIPVLITAEPPWGSVKVRLTSVSGSRPRPKGD